MIAKVLLGLGIVVGCLVLARTGWAQMEPPTPDPHPSACHAGWCQAVTFVAYDYEVAAIDKTTGETLPGLYFACHVPTRWHGKPNRYGRSVCVLREGSTP